MCDTANLASIRCRFGVLALLAVMGPIGDHLSPLYSSLVLMRQNVCFLILVSESIDEGVEQLSEVHQRDVGRVEAENTFATWLAAQPGYSAFVSFVNHV